ncbi:phage holin family protein [Staphylococcus sp. mip270_02]|uniref:phage holin family protein n=1 Tax=Staphylococcus xylosus TaxID=1288 RepID=UPI002ED91EE6
MEEITFKFTENETFDTLLYSGNMNFIYFLIILMLIDIITGITKAFKNKHLWSRKALFGYARKILIFFIIILANIMDQLLGLNNGLVTVTVFFYIANEGLSIIENCSEMGIPVPSWINDKLLVVKNDSQTLKQDFKEEFTTKHTKDIECNEIQEAKLKTDNKESNHHS